MLQIAADLDPIDYYIDVVLLIQGQRGRIVQGHYITVDHGAHKPLPCQLLEHLLMFTLAAFDDGGHDHESRVNWQRQHLIDHL